LSILNAAFYAKNVPAWERIARVAVSAAVVAYALTLPGAWSWGVAASAVAFAVTGLFGFCPACAMIGRRPLNQPLDRPAESESLR
jgi:hypothetical protein